MHELSIALSLVDAVQEELPRLGENARILSVRIRVGPLSGIAPEALAFAFDVATEESPLAGARLEIEDVPLSAYCPSCRVAQVMMGPFDLRCPACGTATPEIVTGRELELLAVEVEDGPANR
jgi:hydrogenase nickel incorporation protein HypA/HybF